MRQISSLFARRTASARFLIAASAISTSASAHTGAESHIHDSFLSGFVHPLFGLDHLAAMVAVGLWSALAARKAGPELAWGPAGFAAMLLAGAALAQGPLPYWAYPVPKPAPGAAPKPDNTILKSLPGTKKRFTEAGVNDRFNVPDWYPADHPAAPPIVLHGRKPNVFACGYCHLPNGQGRPENASLAGQPLDEQAASRLQQKLSGALDRRAAA